MQPEPENDASLRVRFFETLQRRRAWILGACAALTALLVFWGSGIVWREDIFDLLPDRDPGVKDYRRILKSFRPTDYMYIAVGLADENNAPDQERLIAAADALASRLQTAAGRGPDCLFDKVRCEYPPDVVLQALDFLRAHRAALFTDKDARRIEEKLKPDSIRLALANWRKILTQSPAPALSQALSRDPLYFDESLVERLDALRAMQGGVRPHRGRLFSEDLRHILIIAQPRHPSTDSQRAKDLIAYVDNAIAQTLRGEPASGVRVAYIAGHRFGLENADRIKRDLKFTISLSLAGILILSFLAFRRPHYVPLVLLPVAFGAAFAAGVARWIAPSISAISIGCGAMLIGIADDYGIHLLYHADQELEPKSGRRAMARLLARLATPILLCAATTIIAFATLLLSAMPGYRQLGLFALLGILGAAAFALTVLPLLVRPRKAPRRPSALWPVSAFFGTGIDWIARRRRLFLVLLVAATLVCAAGLPRLRFEGDYRKLNAVSPATQEEWDRVASVFGEAMESVSVAVVGKDLEDAVQRDETVRAELERLRAAGVVAAFRSVSPFFPSRSAQEKNVARWMEFWTPERVRALKGDLASAALAQRIRPETFEPFLGALSGPAPFIDAKPENAGLLGDLLGTQCAENESETLIATSLRLSTPDGFPVLVDAMERAAPGTLVASGPDFMRYLVRLISKELVRMGGIALALVLLSILIVVRRPVQVALLVAPILLSVVWTFGTLGWLDIRINLMNSIVCVFIFGLAIDYSVFIVGVAEHGGVAGDERLAHSGGAATFAALTTLIGLGALTLASHPALRTIGATVLIGVAGDWIAATLVVALVRTRKPTDSPDRRV